MQQLSEYLNRPDSRVICFTPSELDPRYEPNQLALKTSSLEADLKALRPAFDGLIMYGYHEASTPRTLELAAKMDYRTIFLGIWDPRSFKEVSGVAELARLYHDELNIAVIVGNEGLTFDRYQLQDLSIAAGWLKELLPDDVPLTTTEPLVGYERKEVVEFGDFLLPNIHPVFDRPNFDTKQAVNWVRDEAARLHGLSNKMVLVKETGFPHAGKEKYSPELQQEFWQAYLNAGLRQKNDSQQTTVFHGVGFEAFDLPWKSEASGLSIEKSWGLLNENREPWPAWQVWKQSVSNR